MQQNVNVIIRNRYKGYFDNMDTEMGSKTTSVSFHTYAVSYWKFNIVISSVCCYDNWLSSKNFLVKSPGNSGTDFISCVLKTSMYEESNRIKLVFSHGIFSASMMSGKGVIMNKHNPVKTLRLGLCLYYTT